MKNIFLFTMLMTLGNSFAQEKFELTPQGFVNSDTPANTYLVMEAPGVEKAQLFNKVLTYLHTVYVNPDVSLSVMDGELITVNGTATDAIRRNNMHVFDINYTYTVRFKDGKIRVDAPGFKLTNFSTKSQELHLVWTGWSLGGDDLGIYGKKDKLKSEKAKEDLESFFNTRFQSLFAAAQTDTESW